MVTFGLVEETANLWSYPKIEFWKVTQQPLNGEVYFNIKSMHTSDIRIFCDELEESSDLSFSLEYG